MNDQQIDRLLALLGSMADSLSEIVRDMAPEAPNYKRPIGDYAAFDWAGIGAVVVKADAYGPSQVEWQDQVFTRRSSENKFGEAIWFSRADGKDADGNNKYVRLITFKTLGEAEPISRKAERAVTATPSAAQPGRRSRPRRVQAITPPSTPHAQPAPASAVQAPAAEPPGWVEDGEADFASLPSASAEIVIPPTQPAPVGPVSAGRAGGDAADHPAAPAAGSCPNCGQSIQHDNPQCSDHRAPRIGAGRHRPRARRQATLDSGLVGGLFRDLGQGLRQALPALLDPGYRGRGSLPHPDDSWILRLHQGHGGEPGGGAGAA